MSSVKGIANKNPGNIKMTSISWKGEIPHHLNTDGVFEQFYQMEYGVRAAVVNLINGYFRVGLNTISKIIARYAPNSENNTSAYISTMESLTGWKRNAVIKPTRKNMERLVAAIFTVEVGRDQVRKISPFDFKKGFDLVPTSLFAQDTGNDTPSASSSIAGGKLMLGLFTLLLAGKIISNQTQSR